MLFHSVCGENQNMCWGNRKFVWWRFKIFSCQSPRSIYSWFIKPLFLLQPGFQSWVVAYFKLIFQCQSKKKHSSHFHVKQLLSADDKILKKPPSKIFFPYWPEVPKRPKQKNLCSKMWLIDQLCIKLGSKQSVQKSYVLWFT